jgi:hypothetical protein
MLGDKLWEGKSEGAGAIKSIDMEGVTSEYSWSANLMGVGKCKGVDGMLHVTAISMTPPKGVGTSKDQGIFMAKDGEMAVMKGLDMMKMVKGVNPAGVGLWCFMTMSEKLMWMNDTIAVAVIEAMDPMWMEFKISIHERK